MPFNDPDFLYIFLPVVLAGYFGLSAIGWGRNATFWWLGVCSLTFYGIGSSSFIPVLLALTFFNYWAGERLAKNPDRHLVTFGICVDLGILAWYKYSNFAILNANTLFETNFVQVNLALPLAISFFTFQKVGYLVDAHRGDHTHWKLREFFLLVWFFPQMIAGPIVRPHEFITQLRGTRPSPARMQRDLAIGLTLFLVGLFKKLVIADNAATYADLMFNGVGAGHGPRMAEAWVGVLSYTLQIYFDFSGYSDMAIGLGRMFGFRLPINFFSPYRAGTIIEFWRRWHMTLSRFLRDYLYFPLGGNRKGPWRRHANLMVVMLLGGLWHGANWTFVLWGAMHGTYLVVAHLFGDWRHRQGLPAIPSWAARTLTFTAVVFAWVPFRAPDMHVTLSIWSGMIGLNGLSLPNLLARPLVSLGLDVAAGNFLQPFIKLNGQFRFVVLLPISLLVALMLPNVYQWLAYHRPALYIGPAEGIRLPPVVRWGRILPMAVLSAALLVAVLQQGKTQTYLYWQF